MNGAQPRVSSPEPGSSILMTSAPMSPSSIVQNGPASTDVRSMTFSPSRGGMHVYQNPRSFHHAKPPVNQMARFANETSSPTFHQSSSPTEPSANTIGA